MRKYHIYYIIPQMCMINIKSLKEKTIFRFIFFLEKLENWGNFCIP